MKNFILVIVAAGAVLLAATGLATTAFAAPTSESSVDTTVNQLRSNGYRVIVNRVGTAIADQCTVSAVRPGQTHSRTDSGIPGAGGNPVTTISDKTVYVDVSC